MSEDTFKYHLDFNLKNLAIIYNDLVYWLEHSPDQNQELLTERIKQMTEFQVWGEQHNEAFFEFFCEKNVTEILLKLLQKTTSRDIVNEIIQSLSMYLLNLKKPTNINYILSNNAINEFITHPFDFGDDEIVAYYISFLKGLSLRMNAIPLDLFYNQKYMDFPLLTYATRFYNYPNSMVKAAVQNITLNILKIPNPKLDIFFSNFPFITYFVNLNCYLKDIWIQIDDVLPDSHIKNYYKLSELLDNQYDILVYIDDIFRLGREKVNQILANAMLSYLIIPTLIAPLTSSKKGLISLNLSQYFLALIFSTISYGPLLEAVYILLFSPKLNESLLNLSQQLPKEPSSYQKNWNFISFWDQYEDIIIRRYTDLLRQIKGGDEIDKVTNPFANRAFRQPKQTSQGLLNFLNVGKLFFSQPNTTKAELEEEHINLSKSTGIVTDPTMPGLGIICLEAPLNIVKRFKDSFTEKGDPLQINILRENPVRSIFLMFLMSKDDNMAALMCSVLSSSLNNPHISAKASWICGLMCELTYYRKTDQMQSEKGTASFKKDIISKSYTVKHLLDLLYRLLIVDPVFRLSTMSLIVKLIIELSWTSDEKVSISPENLRVFNEGYLNAINKTMRSIQTNTMVDYYAEVHNAQWDKIYKKDLEEISRKDLLYTLLPVVEDPEPGIDLYMRLPFSDYEKLQEVVSVFFLFRKIRYCLIRESKYSREFVEGTESYLHSDNASNYWEEGKYYELDQRKLLPCYIKNKGVKQFCYIAEDEENFILITPDYTKAKWANILQNVKLKYVEATVDRADPRLLMLIINSKEKLMNRTIIFDDHTLCLAAKKMMQENKKFFKHFETTKVLKDVETAKSDIYLLKN